MAQTMSQPNILLINCDDLGYGDLGCYGSKVHLTPAIDRLAAEGRRFTDFYQASAVCTPSRAGMLTGCYPVRLGFTEFDAHAVLFPGQAHGLGEGEITLGHLLREAGYRTALVGKWHCGDQPEFLPTRRGFDHYFGLPYSNDMGRMHVRPAGPPLPLLRGTEVVQEQPDQTALTERYVEESVRFLREDRTRPFFLYFSHLHVHLPLLVAERFMKESRNGPYGAAVACIDWALAALRAELDAQGRWENTLVMFTSDNGGRCTHGGSNHPLRGTKAHNYEGGIRVPLIIRWPGRVPAGTVCRDVTTALDFFPTLAAAAGARMPTDRVIDGEDATRLWVAPESGARRPVKPFFYYWLHDIEAVRLGAWKLHLRGHDWTAGSFDRCELYNLEEDPGEGRNLYAERPDKVADLRAEFERGAELLGDRRTGRPGRGHRARATVARPRPLTAYDPTHPYLVAMYDGEAG
jgi:arylsulfatase A-like enzyme